MLLAALLAAALGWWLHQRGELLPDLARWGGAAAAALIAIRMLETGRPIIAASIAALGYGWWRLQSRQKSRMPRDEARALALLGLETGADANAIQTAWRTRFATAHPDAGGSDEAARAVTAARDLLIKRQQKSRGR